MFRGVVLLLMLIPKLAFCQIGFELGANILISTANKIEVNSISTNTSNVNDTSTLIYKYQTAIAGFAFQANTKLNDIGNRWAGYLSLPIVLGISDLNPDNPKGSRFSWGYGAGMVYNIASSTELINDPATSAFGAGVGFGFANRTAFTSVETLDNGPLKSNSQRIYVAEDNFDNEVSNSINRFNIGPIFQLFLYSPYLLPRSLTTRVLKLSIGYRPSINTGQNYFEFIATRTFGSDRAY